MNKNLLLIALIAFTILSCSQTRRASIEDSVNPNDTCCIRELGRAKKDIESNKFVYCNYVAFFSLRCESEMDSLLRIYKINFKNEYTPDVNYDKNLNYHCYCELMTEKIREKYSKNFTDSLLYIADSLYVSKNIDKIFDGHGLC
jgi:hypothetical protein